MTVNAVELTYRFGQREADSAGPPPSPAAARARLEAGSRAVNHLVGGLDGTPGVARRTVTVDGGEFGTVRHGRMSEARPFAAILGCADSRVPIELVFTEGPNDLYVMRVAGNTLGPQVLASLRYATEHLASSIRLLVTLGHSDCGAVKAAVDVYLNPSGYLAFTKTHNLRSLVDSLQFAVHVSARGLAAVHAPTVVDRPGYRAALADMAVAVNAALGARTIAHDFNRDGLASVWGVYLLGKVALWSARPDADELHGLAEPPGDETQCTALVRRLAASERIAGLLAAD
jgi:carbonic anhydrase